MWKHPDRREKISPGIFERESEKLVSVCFSTTEDWWHFLLQANTHFKTSLYIVIIKTRVDVSLNVLF